MAPRGQKVKYPFLLSWTMFVQYHWGGFSPAPTNSLLYQALQPVLLSKVIALLDPCDSVLPQSPQITPCWSPLHAGSTPDKLLSLDNVSLQTWETSF